jgi:hypothetical protein
MPIRVVGKRHRRVQRSGTRHRCREAAGCSRSRRIGIVVRARSAASHSAKDASSGRGDWVRRRELLKAAAAATFMTGVAPRLGRSADRAKTLVFVGVADLSVLDPVMTGFRPTRNAAYLVFDTLYGIDTEWKAQPQMVGSACAAQCFRTARWPLRSKRTGLPRPGRRSGSMRQNPPAACDGASPLHALQAAL